LKLALELHFLTLDVCIDSLRLCETDGGLGGLLFDENI
jgi:hypothetical protein